MSSYKIFQNNKEDIVSLLVGRTVVAVNETELLLDNGVTVNVIPNSGCWMCPSGNYSVDFLNNVDNVITSVKVKEKHNITVEHGFTKENITTYSIFVYTGGSKDAKGEKTVLLSVSGEDGNGWYGTGYQLEIVTEKSETYSHC